MVVPYVGVETAVEFFLKRHCVLRSVLSIRRDGCQSGSGCRRRSGRWRRSRCRCGRWCRSRRRDGSGRWGGCRSGLRNWRRCRRWCRCWRGRRCRCRVRFTRTLESFGSIPSGTSATGREQYRRACARQSSYITSVE
jgi:hypothetical protein